MCRSAFLPPLAMQVVLFAEDNHSRPDRCLVKARSR
jgi:hypothetical protein